MTPLAFISFIVVYTLFIVWYGGRSKPLTEEETEKLLKQIWVNHGFESEPDVSLYSELRELSKSDDGRSYYMVNLMKFRLVKEDPDDIDPQLARKLYGKGIMMNLIKRAGHPVFIGNVTGKFITDDTLDEWDQLGIIRYRSRRDMLKMIASIKNPKLGDYKWASLIKTQVFPTSIQMNIGFIRLLVAVVLMSITSLIF